MVICNGTAMRDAYKAPGGANNFPCRFIVSAGFHRTARAARTNSHGEVIVIFGHSKSIVAAFVASAVMAAGFAAPALADVEAMNRGGGNNNVAPTRFSFLFVV